MVRLWKGCCGGGRRNKIHPMPLHGSSSRRPLVETTGVTVESKAKTGYKIKDSTGAKTNNVKAGVGRAKRPGASTKMKAGVDVEGDAAHFPPSAKGSHLGGKLDPLTEAEHMREGTLFKTTGGTKHEGNPQFGPDLSWHEENGTGTDFQVPGEGGSLDEALDQGFMEENVGLEGPNEVEASWADATKSTKSSEESSPFQARRKREERMDRMSGGGGTGPGKVANFMAEPRATTQGRGRKERRAMETELNCNKSAPFSRHKSLPVNLCLVHRLNEGTTGREVHDSRPSRPFCGLSRGRRSRSLPNLTQIKGRKIPELDGWRKTCLSLRDLFEKLMTVYAEIRETWSLEVYDLDSVERVLGAHQTFHLQLQRAKEREESVCGQIEAFGIPPGTLARIRSNLQGLIAKLEVRIRDQRASLSQSFDSYIFLAEMNSSEAWIVETAQALLACENDYGENREATAEYILQLSEIEVTLSLMENRMFEAGPQLCEGVPGAAHRLATLTQSLGGLKELCSERRLNLEQGVEYYDWLERVKLLELELDRRDVEEDRSSTQNDWVWYEECQLEATRLCRDGIDLIVQGSWGRHGIAAASARVGSKLGLIKDQLWSRPESAPLLHAAFEKQVDWFEDWIGKQEMEFKNWNISDPQGKLNFEEEVRNDSAHFFQQIDWLRDRLPLDKAEEAYERTAALRRRVRLGFPCSGPSKSMTPFSLPSATTAPTMEFNFTLNINVTNVFASPRPQDAKPRRQKRTGLLGRLWQRVKAGVRELF